MRVLRDWAQADMTPWFPPENLPARQGVYQTILWAGAPLQYSYWDGELWSMGYDTADQAGVGSSLRPRIKRYWRGLARKPFDIDELCDDAMERLRKAIDIDYECHRLELSEAALQDSMRLAARHFGLNQSSIDGATRLEKFRLRALFFGNNKNF